MSTKRFVWVILKISLCINLVLLLGMSCMAQDNRLAQGYSLLQRGQFQATKSYLEQIIPGFDPNKEPLSLGEAHYLLGKVSGLMQLDIKIVRNPNYNKALSLLENSPAHSALCLMMKLDMEPKTMIEQLGKVSDLDTKYPQLGAYYHLVATKMMYSQNENKAAQIHIEQAIKRYEQLSLTYERGEAYNLQAELYRKGGLVDLSMQYVEKAEGIFHQLGGGEHNMLFLPLVIRGILLYDQSQYREAINTYNRVVDIILKFNPDSPSLLNIYNNLCNAYQKIGDYDLAEKTMKLIINKNVGSSGVYRYYNNLGNIYLEKGDLQNAKSALLQSIRLGLIVQPKKANDSVELARPYHSIAAVYRLTGKLDSAYYCAQKGLFLRKKNRAFTHIEVGRSFLELAQCNFASGNLSKANLHLDTAILIYKKQTQIDHAELSSAYLIKGQVNPNNFSLSSLYLDSALVSIGYRPGNFQGISAPSSFIDIIQSKAQLLVKEFQKTKQVSFSIQAQQQFNIGVHAIPDLRSLLTEATAKAMLLEKYKSFLGYAIDNSLRLYQHSKDNQYLANAFAFNEQNKSLSLLEALLKRGINFGVQIPQNLLQEEKSLHSKLRNLEKQQLTTNSTKSSEEITKLRLEYSLLQHKILNGYPNYYQRLNENAKVDVVKLQNTCLSPNQTLLEYFVADTAIYAFIVQKKFFKVISIKKDFPLETWSSQMVKGITDPYLKSPKNEATEEKMLGEYARAAQDLYKKLIIPLKAHLSPSLVIIPSNELAQIPFESLLSAAPKDLYNFGTYPYLLKDYAVNYCYSAALWHEMVHKKHESPPKKSVLGLAPFYKGKVADIEREYAAKIPGVQAASSKENDLAVRSGLVPLPSSGEEVYSYSQMFQGQFFVDTQATLSRFLNMAADFRILALSTHGILDHQQSEFSYIAFASNNKQEVERLYVSDLYGIKLNADLVLLSACESGIGEVLPGEGVISLARAFTSAGAKSIASTLWMANDLAIKEVTVAFGRNIKQGMDKATALQQAKLTYLVNHRGERSHPFFWAGLVIMGDSSPIN